MAFTPSPDFNPIQPIPNGPFYSPEAWSFQTPGGPIIFGSGFLVNAADGSVQNAPGPNPPGTVTLVTGGTGIVTSPAGGITSTGSVSLATVPGVAGSYSYATVTVDTFGRVTAAANGVPPIQTISGTAPIVITGAAPNVTVGINASSTSNSGAVQLVDNLNTPATDSALTAAQGFLLNQMTAAIQATAGNQYLAATFNAALGQAVTVTTAGSGTGFSVGANLPAAAAGNLGAYAIVTVPGSYNPPGGSGPFTTVAGDQFLSDGTNWVYLPVGFRAANATTSSAGVVELATPAEVLPLADNTRAVTPFSMSTLLASTTQRGLVELATDAEALALTSTTVALTPSNLAALVASPTQAGLVQLTDNLTATGITTAPTSRALNQLYNEAILKSIITANGDLIVGQSNAVPAILPKGTNGSVLTIDVTAPLGMDWNVPDAPASVPVGVVSWFTTDDPTKLPVGWVVCDGSSYSTSTTITPGVPNPFYDLFDIIGYTFGGAGATFQVPDLTGQFIRGFDPSGTVDAPGRAFGSNQTDQFLQHSHGVTDPGHIHTSPSHTHQISGLPAISTATVIGNDNGLYRGNQNFGFRTPTTSGSGGGTTGTAATINANTTGVTIDLEPPVAPPNDQTRPLNVALLPIIKYSYLYD